MSWRNIPMKNMLHISITDGYCHCYTCQVNLMGNSCKLNAVNYSNYLINFWQLEKCIWLQKGVNEQNNYIHNAKEMPSHVSSSFSDHHSHVMQFVIAASMDCLFIAWRHLQDICGPAGWVQTKEELQHVLDYRNGDHFFCHGRQEPKVVYWTHGASVGTGVHTWLLLIHLISFPQVF